MEDIGALLELITHWDQRMAALLRQARSSQDPLSRHVCEREAIAIAHCATELRDALGKQAGEYRDEILGGIRHLTEVTTQEFKSMNASVSDLSTALSTLQTTADATKADVQTLTAGQANVIAALQALQAAGGATPAQLGALLTQVQGVQASVTTTDANVQADSAAVNAVLNPTPAPAPTPAAP